METYTNFLVILVYCCYLCLYSVTGDSVLYPPFEFQRVPREMETNKLSFPNSNSALRAYHVPQQQIIHTGAMQSQPVPTAGKVQSEYPSSYFNEFLNTVNEFSGPKEEENQKFRAASRDDNIINYKNLSPNTYTRPNINSWIPTIPESTSIYVPPKTIQNESIDKASPKFNLLEPIASKMSSKMSGLMELVLALLGAGPDNIFMKGFKEIVVDGLLRPLLVAKGGLKALISKLAVPLISLVLINVEILITVWWLWEDCPKPQIVSYQSSYQRPVTDNYTYNTTY